MKAVSAIALLAGLVYCAPVQAADVYVNGKLVRGITELTLENCTVTFTQRGDVQITAPGFKVLDTAAKGDQAKEPIDSTSAKLLKHRYFLFTQTTSSGNVPYSFELWINDSKIKEFNASQDKLTVEVTLYLKPGSNKVEIKSLYKQKPDTSASDSYSIFIGRGSPASGSLEITKLLLNYSRRGSDVGDASDVMYIDTE